MPNVIKTLAAKVVKPKYVTVIVPCKSEDDDHTYIYIAKGKAHAVVKDVNVVIGNVGPKSYGHYSKGAWRMVLYPV